MAPCRAIGSGLHACVRSLSQEEEKSLVATTLWALPSLREPPFDMKALLHFFEVAPRWDRQILTIAMCSSVLLLVLGATAELIAL